MRRMKEADARELFTFMADRIDIESIPLDDDKTKRKLYHLSSYRSSFKIW